MLYGKFPYIINRFSTPKASVLVMSFQEVKKYHLSQAIRRCSMRHA